MKRKLGVLLALVLSFCMTALVWADAGKALNVDYKTDYYMIVESPDGGVDMYSEPDFDSTKLNEDQIPNGAAIHVEGESESDDGRVWAYAQHHGMFGFIPEDDLKPATRQEAIDSEISLYEGESVDYEIVVNAKDGSVSLYNGPGQKYGTVSGSTEIANGQTVQITREVDTGKGGLWGETTVDGFTGWVNIGIATNSEDNSVELVKEGEDVSLTPVPAADGTSTVSGAETSSQDGEISGQNGEASVEGEDPAVQEAEDGDNNIQDTDLGETGRSGAAAEEKSSAAKPTATPAPAATSTPTPTPKPTATSTPTPTPEPTATSTSTPTPEPTKTSTPTPEPTKTSTPTPEPTDTSTPTPEPTEEAEPSLTETAEASPTEAAGQEASSDDVESSSWVKNPVIWILAVAIIIAVIVVIYLLKKNKKQDQ